MESSDKDHVLLMDTALCRLPLVMARRLAKVNRDTILRTTPRNRDVNFCFNCWKLVRELRDEE